MKEIESKDFNKWLGKYFAQKPLYLDEPIQKKPNIRKLVEQPWQQTKAGMQVEVKRLFTDILYLSARTLGCDIWQLLNDYSCMNINSDLEILEYKSFIVKHVQSLIMHDGQFIALINHEGFPKAKEQINTILNSGVYRSEWIHTSKLIEEQNIEISTTFKSIVQLSCWKFDLSTVIGLAAKDKIAFHLIHLGKIGIIDIEKSSAFDQKIEIRGLIVLGIFPSEDAKSLAVAYENGEADIIELEWSNRALRKQSLIDTIKYKLPQFEAPSMFWDCECLIYQKDDELLSSYSIVSRKKTCLIAHEFEFSNYELRSSAKLNQKLILALSSEAATKLILFENGHFKQIFQIENADTIAICTFCSSMLVACFTNREILVLDISETVNNLKYVVIKEMPTCMACDNESIIIATNSDNLYLWQFNEPDGPSLLHLPKTKDTYFRHIAFSSDNTILSLSQSSAKVLRVSLGNDHEQPTVLSLFTTLFHYYSVIRNKEGNLVLRKDSGIVIKLTDHEPRITKFMMDGSDNLLYARSDGSGFILDCISESRYLINNIPVAITAITGDPNGGFWIANRRGDIFHIDTHGDVQMVWSSKSVMALAQELLSTGSKLVWRGWVDEEIESGEAYNDTIIFFEILNNNQLHLIGKRRFNKSEGYIRTIEYDNYPNSLIVIFENAAKVKRLFREGSVEDFIRKNECKKPINWLPDDIDSVRSKIGKNLFILCRNGSMYFFDTQTSIRNAVLTPSIPIKMISIGCSKQNDFLLISDSNDNIYRCDVKNSLID